MPWLMLTPLAVLDIPGSYRSPVSSIAKHPSGDQAAIRRSECLGNAWELAAIVTRACLAVTASL